MIAIIALAVLGVLTMMADILGYKKWVWHLIILGLAGIMSLTLLQSSVLTDFLGIGGGAARLRNLFPSWISDGNIFSMLFIDGYSSIFMLLIELLLMIWFLVSKEEYQSGVFNRSDNYALILFAGVGALCLTAYSNLAMLFLGIEILSIPLFILAGSLKKDISSNEASIKYFVMGAFATCILLLGIAFVYGATGTFDMILIGNYPSNNESISPLFHIGSLLMLIGIGFKVSAVPFHFWTPDVYTGSPIYITAFMATVVKTAAFAAYFRLFTVCFVYTISFWDNALWAIAIVTILVGNFTAVYQSSVKRMLAYSGIAQAGYMLLALLIPTDKGQSALFMYAASYTLSTFAAFAILAQVRKIKGSDGFDAFAGLGKSHPLMAVVMTIAMLSLAGIPPTLGFFGKFYLFTEFYRANMDLIWVLGVALLGSLVSVYYYFRVIISMYGQSTELSSSTPVSGLNKLVMVLLAGLIIVLGILPDFISKIGAL